MSTGTSRGHCRAPLAGPARVGAGHAGRELRSDTGTGVGEALPAGPQLPAPRFPWRLSSPAEAQARGPTASACHPSPSPQGPLPPSHLLTPAGPQTLGPRGRQPWGLPAAQLTLSLQGSQREARGLVTESPTRHSTQLGRRRVRGNTTTGSTRGVQLRRAMRSARTTRGAPNTSRLTAAAGKSKRLPATLRDRAEHAALLSPRPAHALWLREHQGPEVAGPAAAGTRRALGAQEPGPQVRALTAQLPALGSGATAPRWSHRSSPFGTSVAGLLAHLPAGHGLGGGPLGRALPPPPAPRPPPRVSSRPLAEPRTRRQPAAHLVITV